MATNGDHPDESPSIPPSEAATMPELSAQPSWEDLARSYANLCARMYDDKRRLAHVEAAQTTILLELREIRDLLRNAGFRAEGLKK